jgi:hypothetical protein
MERKIIFLDIDGVLQPVSSQIRFEHCHMDIEKSSMPKLYKRLEYNFKIDFSKYSQYDVAAVYFDWDKTAVSLLRLVLKITGSQIVLSSDWKMDGFERMKDFFTIHGLEKYYIDITKDYGKIDENFIQKVEKQHKETHGEKAYMSHRSVEILEWLHRNPDVKKWVAIDDMNLKGIDSNFVNTLYRFTDENAEQCVKILTGSLN